MAQAKISLLDPGRAEAVYAWIVLQRIRKDHIFIGEDLNARPPLTSRARKADQYISHRQLGVHGMKAGKRRHLISTIYEILDVCLSDLEFRLRQT